MKDILFFTISLLLTINTFSQVWELKDPGGGGAVPAIAVLDNSDVVYVGSDIGGIRHSNDRAESYEPVNYGISGVYGRNISEIEIFNQGVENIVFATSTGGIIIWDTVKTNSGDIHWKTLFNKTDNWGIISPLSFGPIESNYDGTKIFVGVGNLNKLKKLNYDKYTKIPDNKAGTILIFDIDYTTGVNINTTPTEINIFKLLGKPVIDTCQVTDICATGINNENSFWVSTTNGIYKVTEEGEGNYKCVSKFGTGLLDNNILSVAVSNENVNDVVVLVHEGRKNKTGGVWHTTNGEAGAPVWIDKTGATKFHKNACEKLVRSKVKPAEVVGIGKYGVFFTEDISQPTATILWKKVLDGSYALEPEYDGWLRKTGKKLLGAKSVAIRENTSGIEEIYFGGFQGFIYKLERSAVNPAAFNVSQIYTNQYTDDSGNKYYRGRGMPLMVNHRIEINPYDNKQVYFLYGDNAFFVSNDSGNSFYRPYTGWNNGQDLLWGDNIKEAYIGLSVGNHVEDFKGGSVVKTNDKGKTWDIIGGGVNKENQLPNAAITSMAKYNGKIYITAFDKGLYALNGTNWELAGFSGEPIFSLQTATVSVNNNEVLFACMNEKVEGELLYYYYNNKWIALGDKMHSLVKSDETRLKFENGNLLVLDRKGNIAFAKIDSINSVSDLGSVTWNKLDTKVFDITYSEHDKLYYLATGLHGILTTTDLTLPVDKWITLTDDGLSGWKRFLSVKVDSKGNVYAGGGNGVYRLESMNRKNKYKE